METIKSLGVFTVATNKYLEYWFEMVDSFDRNMGQILDCTFYVFTDRPDEATKFGQSLKNKSKISVTAIPNLGWPDATLLRFELIETLASKCKQDVLMHLDADMLVHQKFDEQFAHSRWKNGIFLVAHPGFFTQYLKSQTKILGLTKILLKLKQILGQRYPMRPLGAWETNPKSQAYVEKRKRRLYVCGATWGGTNESFWPLISELASQTRTDRSNEVIATWHDESHLNRWASTNDFALLTPNYCFAETFSEGQGLLNIIQAVDKGKNSTRT